MEPNAASPAATHRGADWRKRALYLAVIAALIIAILLIRGCRSHSAPNFDYFRAKADELKNDPAAIQQFVADQVATLDYRGNVKGALATLWNKAGSPEEKKAMADALMRYAKPESRTLSLDDVAPRRDKSLDTSADAKAAFHLKIIHRVIKEADKDESKPVDTAVFDGIAGDLVGDVHTIEESGPLKTTITLRGKSEPSRLKQEIAVPDDAVAEQVVFIYDSPAIPSNAAPAPDNGDKQNAAPPTPTTVVRELWHTGNRFGANHPNLHDRHDFVVLPTRVDKFVREKEEQILKEHERSQSPEANGYLKLLDFAVQSDRQLAGLEKHRKVKAQFNKPRILILSQFGADEMPDKKAWALDLRADDVTLSSDFTTAYLATQARSFMESGLEQIFLGNTTGVPSTSTFDVFSRLKDDYPNTCARRLIAIRKTLDDLDSFSALNATATFTVHTNPPLRWKTSPAVVVSRLASGALHLKGPPANKKFIERLAATPEAVKIKDHDSTFEDDFTNLEDLSVAVETALMSADVTPGLSPDYVLESKLDRGAEPLVEPNSQFVFAWGAGESRTDQRIQVVGCGQRLMMKWRVQTGAMPAAGTRAISADALAGATIHNPWYHTGPSDQKRATSFCVSRAVFQKIKAGQSVELSIQARLSDKNDPQGERPIEYTAPLKPVGHSSHTVTINGKPNSVNVINCKLKDADVAILDDPTYPIGMADRLTNITTGIRARLVDEAGVPISGASVTVTASRPSDTIDPIKADVVTAGDGSMRLPPPVELDSGQTTYGKANVKVLVSPQYPPVELEVDLTAPGLDTVDIKITRPRPKLLYIMRSNINDLNDLPMSDQVKRNARRDVNAGRLVVIPDRVVSDGLHDLIGYYACNRESGYYVGVTEDGLNGSSAWEQAAMSAVKAADKARKEIMKDPRIGSSAPFHMFRGAVISWWVYCTDRLAGDTHKVALIDTLAAMQGWAKSTNLSTYVNQAIADALSGSDPTALAKLDGKLTGMFTNMINSGISQAEGDTANAAFEIGYISGTAGLAALIGDDGSD